MVSKFRESCSSGCLDKTECIGSKDNAGTGKFLYMALPTTNFQQELVLSELHQYTTQVPKPEDVNSVKLTLQYLEACNRLFEKGFLSHGKICGTGSPVLDSISMRFSYFLKWHEALSKIHKYLKCLSST